MTVSGLHMSELTDGFCLRLGEKATSPPQERLEMNHQILGAAAWWV